MIKEDSQNAEQNRTFKLSLLKSAWQVIVFSKFCLLNANPGISAIQGDSIQVNVFPTRYEK